MLTVPLHINSAIVSLHYNDAIQSPRLLFQTLAIMTLILLIRRHSNAMIMIISEPFLALVQ